ncbi:DUF2092 domain-containing protein [Arthrobacter sp. SDTb3-6]|uniref:LolA family protein n=1 Tax=Arthrobacter sp. SDTb3-6 TaxID=2713571 RepID=UPI00159DDEAD|nr:DUF2092 domain-containing protein [Arthrobacter sp. SDTb3-6]NVN00599.1 DUF2092 domain-containing protein [Arthrobacter sp. SDTb3-6]
MPAAAMPAVIAAAVLAGPLQASSTVDLPHRTPQQVLALMAGNTVHQLSGTVQESARLGLPQLPDLGPGSPGQRASLGPGASSGATAGGTSAAARNPLKAATITRLLGFLTGPHTVRVYLDGAGRQRVQVLDKLAERDLIHNGTTVWTYNSATNKATETTLPGPGMRNPRLHNAKMHNPKLHNPKLPRALAPGAFEQTPSALAAELVKGLDPTTQLSLGPNTKVAKRGAYELQLIPRTTKTLIGKVTIAVDAATGLPLRVTVTARGQDSAAVDIGFSTLDLAAPPASTFMFTPPPGTSVTRRTVPAPKLHPHAVGPRAHARTHAAPKVDTSGTGWAAITEAPAGTVPSDLTAAPAVARLLQPVPGGHALSTALFTVLITPGGALYAGAVPLAALEQAAAAR